MMFIELFVPKGALDASRRAEVSDRLVTELLADEGAPEEVMDSARALTQVVVHEPESWSVGGRQQDSKPRYLVRVTVPGSWHTKDMGQYIIPRVTRVLAESEDDPESLFDEPRAWVQVLGLREGSLGAFGRPLSSTDITKLITKDYRQPGAPVAEVDQDTALDPVCGMTVPWAEATLTLEYHGTRYAFCAPACRKVFAEERAIPA